MNFKKCVIYIYKDEGVDPISFAHTVCMFNKINHKFNVVEIDAIGVKQNQWQNFAVLFVIPGGADLPYLKKLNGLGNDNIKQFIRNGGAYLGICAGAYYASAYVEFDKSGSFEVVGDRELKFFSGKSIGPILAPYNPNDTSSSRAAEITTTFSKLPKVSLYYNGGGFFENAAQIPNTKILAYYHPKHPAIIQTQYGNGRVILSGVHFEYDPHMLNSNDKYLIHIIPKLISDDESRKKLLSELLSILKVF